MVFAVLTRLLPCPANQTSSLCARFCRGARVRRSRSLPPLGSVQLRASGVFRIACENPAFPPRPANGHRGRHRAGSQSKGQEHDYRNHQRPFDASHLRGDQERQEEVLAADWRSLGAHRRQGLQPEARLIEAYLGLLGSCLRPYEAVPEWVRMKPFRSETGFGERHGRRRDRLAETRNVALVRGLAVEPHLLSFATALAAASQELMGRLLPMASLGMPSSYERTNLL